MFCHRIAIDAVALLIVTANGAEVALLKLPSAACVAVIEQVAVAPVADRMCSLPPTIEHALELPALNVSAPVPEPPLVVIVASGSPNVSVDGAVTDSVA